MKSVFTFLAGLIAGILLMYIAIDTPTTPSTNDDSIDGLTLFEEKGECISKKSIKVFQSLGTFGLALEKGSSSFADIYNGIHVLIKSPTDKPFYDEQIISIPKDKCARQIGVYRYETKNDDWKTVPVVIID